MHGIKRNLKSSANVAVYLFQLLLQNLRGICITKFRLE